MTPTETRLCDYLRGITPITAVSDDELAAAREQGVFLLLANRMPQTAFAAELRHAAIVDAIRTRELQAVLSALTGAGIHAILFKGAALAYTHYPRPELRPRSDTDLLIPLGARDAVESVLLRLGYRRPTEIDSALAVGQFHFVKTDDVGVEHALDVHWRLSNVRAFAAVLTYDELVRAEAAVPALGPHAWTVSKIHALLVACVHRIAHHGDATYLLWLFDVHVLARSLTTADRDAFVALASAKRVRAVCARTLSLAQDAFGDLDTAWVESLSTTSGVDEPTALFVGGGLHQIDILKSDLSATAWGAKLQLLREHLFPPPSYMRERYPRWPTLLLPLAYARRIVVGAPRWLRR